jgi:ketosteroid isomerase-like protein
MFGNEAKRGNEMRKVLVLAFVGLSAIWGAPEKAQAQDMVEQKVLQLDRDWARAFVKGDVAAVERIEAADFVFTGPDGSVTGKAEDLSDLKTGNFKAETIELDDLKVHVHGGSAVVTGRSTLKNCKYHGQDVSGQYRFTDVFAKVNGDWHAVASHTTMLPKI